MTTTLVPKIVMTVLRREQNAPPVDNARRLQPSALVKLAVMEPIRAVLSTPVCDPGFRYFRTSWQRHRRRYDRLGWRRARVVNVIIGWWWWLSRSWCWCYSYSYPGSCSCFYSDCPPGVAGGENGWDRYRNHEESKNRAHNF